MKTGRVCAKQNRSWCCSETIEAGAISLFPTFLGLIIGVIWLEYCGAVISPVLAARSWLREHWPGSAGRLSRQDIRWLEWITIRASMSSHLGKQIDSCRIALYSWAAATGYRWDLDYSTTDACPMEEEVA